MCWELFKDFQKETREEIFEELADCKYKITKLQVHKSMLQNQVNEFIKQII